MFRSVLFALSALFFTSLAPAHAADGEAERAAIARELIEIIGGAQMFSQMVDVSLAQSWPAIEEQNPDLSKKDLRIFKEEFAAALRAEVDVIIGETAKIYARHLSVGEMRASINFYKSPEGRAMLTKLPVIMSEAVELGNRFGSKVSANALERARERVKERGVEL
jgi:hypothetical protein